jgi:spermidine synthase
MLRRQGAADGASRSFLPEIFLISGAALLLEVSYTRIISFKLYYYYTYLTIGLALLGLGSGAVFMAVSARLRRTTTGVLLRWCTLLAAAAVVVGYVVVARMPLDTLALWEAGRRRRVVSLAELLLICLGLYVSFLPIGVAVAALFSRRPEHINRLYFSDLAGAALACLIVVPLMAWVGPVSAVAAVAVVLLVVAFRLLEGDHRLARIAVAGATAVMAVVAVRPSLAPTIRTEETKQLRTDHVAASRWSALFRVDAVRFPDNVVLYHDGLWGSAIWPWDGDPASLAHFDHEDRSIPFAALGAPPERLLIIGAAGGHEIQAAIHFGARRIDAVELNPATAGLLRGPFADYAGHLTRYPGVHYVVGDGRRYLAESHNRYDMIWFVAPDSYAASNAASSGAFVLSESYLYTQEMLEESLEHLAPAGMVVMQFGEKDYDRAPNRTTRLVSTAWKAYQAEGISDVADHVAVVTTSSSGILFGGSMTMMKATPFTSDELDRIAARQAEVAGMTVRYLPGRPGDDPSRPVNTVITGGPSALASYPYDVGPITDDRPFFWHFTPYSDVLPELGRTASSIDMEVGIGERVLVLLLGVAVAMAAVFLLLPFVLVRRTWRALPDKGTTAPIFGLLGLAFIAFEITLIQRFSLFLGYPTYSLTVTLMAILLFTGIGALVSPRWHDRARLLLGWLAVAIVALGSFYALLAPRLVDALLAWPTLAKAAVVVVLCAPLGFCLGMFMPLAITLVATDEEHSSEYVAWGWAINGFFSVIGSTLTTIVSMSYGFRAVLLSAVALYLVVIVLLRRLVRRKARPAAPAKTAELLPV